MSSLMFWNGLNGYEPETTGALRPLAERSTTLVDVGANIGLYSMLGALWNPKLSVLAFEPVPAIYRGLLKNIELNGLQQRVKCEQLALANQSGVSTFHLPDSEGLDLETTGSLSPNGWQARKASNKFEVQTVRFDDYELQHPSRIDLIKIDVEDFESEVLMGMERILRRDHPFVICEILNRDHRNERTREFLQAIGYTAYWIIPSVFVRVADFDFQRHYSNFLLSPVATGEILHSPDSLWEKRLSLAS